LRGRGVLFASLVRWILLDCIIKSTVAISLRHDNCKEILPKTPDMLANSQTTETLQAHAVPRNAAAPMQYLPIQRYAVNARSDERYNIPTLKQ
jgi:hypothetical protein